MTDAYMETAESWIPLPDDEPRDLSHDDDSFDPSTERSFDE
jgi:hypothetical protein